MKVLCQRLLRKTILAVPATIERRFRNTQTWLRYLSPCRIRRNTPKNDWNTLQKSTSEKGQLFFVRKKKNLLTLLPKERFKPAPIRFLPFHRFHRFLNQATCEQSRTTKKCLVRRVNRNKTTRFIFPKIIDWWIISTGDAFTQ